MNGNIEFNDEQKTQNSRFLYSKFQASADKPGVVNFLINRKIVKNENGANVFLMGVTILFFSLSIVLFMYGSGYFSSIRIGSKAVVGRPIHSQVIPK